MKKCFKPYATIVVLLFTLFNVICFISPNEAADMNKFDGAFWVGYIFITLAIIGQLVCAYFVFKTDELKKVFYNLPLATVSYAGLILTIVFGSLCMAIPNLPNWFGIIVCFAVLSFDAAEVIKAKTAVNVVGNIDDKVASQTSFIKIAVLNAQNIMNRAANDTAKAECKKVYEALRCSDPMSNMAFSPDEEKITIKMDELASAIAVNNTENAKTLAEETIILIKERNNKCKALK